jgi:hypothetical protein
VSARRSRATEQSLNALRVVNEIIAEELDSDDPRRTFFEGLSAAWDKLDTPRWEAARHALEHDTDYEGEPPLRIVSAGLLVAIDEGLANFYSGTPCDKRRAARDALRLQAMVDHLGHIVEATTRE